jgi:hypothetical protein
MASSTALVNWKTRFFKKTSCAPLVNRDWASEFSSRTAWATVSFFMAGAFAGLLRNTHSRQGAPATTTALEWCE